MLRTFLGTRTRLFKFFGDTPAVNLTRGLPQGMDADILILGCRDLHDALYTIYMQQHHPPRKLDFTCCDVDDYATARNVLMLTLIYGTKLSHQSLWNIYHHRFLDEDDADCIESQAHYLLDIDIPDSPDGTLCDGRIRFCDRETLTQVISTLKRYRDAASHDRRRDRFIPNTLDRLEYSQHHHQYMIDEVGLIPPSPRSSAPMYKEQAGSVRGITDYVWDKGIVDEVSSEATTVNPLVRSALNDKTRCDLLLGYPHNPLLKFHLASASLSVSGKNKVPSSPSSDFQGDLVDTAKKQFADWVLAARQNAHNTTFRFINADCFALAHTLQHNLTTGNPGANWYRRQLDARPLVLDQEAYGGLGDAPRQFDVIDTSHMPTTNGDRFADMTYAYLGLARPLLKDRASSSLYTTLVTVPAVKQDTLTATFRSLFATISILLGLAPIDFWTNATPTSSHDDYYFGLFESAIRSRLDWKLDKYLSAGAARAPEVLSCDADTLAAILTGIYGRFYDEKLLRFDNTSFAELVKAVCRTIKTDVTELSRQLVQTISNDLRCTTPEAIRWLVFSLRTVGGIPVESLEASLTEWIGESWEEVLDPVCLTLRLRPRLWRKFFHTHYKKSHLNMFTSLEVVLCIPRDGDDGDPRYLPHSGMHITFGTVKQIPEMQSVISVEEDPRGFSSDSPMILSFYVPPVRDLMEGNAFIQFAMEGAHGEVFEFHPNGKDHWVTPHRAGLNHLPVFGGGALPTSGLTSTATSSNGSSTRVMADGQGRVDGFHSRVNLVGEEEKQLFRGKAVIRLSQISPFTVTVTVGNSVVYPLHYPVPVAGKKALRVSPTYSDFEVDVHLAEPDVSDILDDYVFPTALGCVAPGGPVVPMTLNVPHLSFQNLPQINTAAGTCTESTASLIRRHALGSCSRSDISLRNLLQGYSMTRLGSFFVRLSFKKRVADIYRATAAVDSPSKPMFFLGHAGGTLQMTILPSGFFLDGGNGSIVLAAAVIPWTMAMQQDPDARAFLQGKHHVTGIKLHDEEMRFWKTMLPAMAERCREWSHGPACEYAAPGAKIPLSLESKGPDAVAKYATLIAISPVFASPLLEDAVDPSVFRDIREALESIRVCHQCGKQDDDPSVKLRLCSKCRKVKYCSPYCEDFNGPAHRLACQQVCPDFIPKSKTAEAEGTVAETAEVEDTVAEAEDTVAETAEAEDTVAETAEVEDTVAETAEAEAESSRAQRAGAPSPEAGGESALN